MKNKTKHITESMKFTVDISDSGKFTVNIQDCRNFTVNISDCRNYSINRQDCAGGVDAKKSMLVIDTPEDCYNCGIRKGYSCGVSGVCGIGKTLPANLRKPDWCPLRD